MLCCGHGKLVTVSPVIFHACNPNTTIPEVASSRVIGWLKLCTFCARTQFLWKT